METHRHTTVSVEWAEGQSVIQKIEQGQSFALTSAAMRHNPFKSATNSSHRAVVIFSFSQPPVGSSYKGKYKQKQKTKKRTPPISITNFLFVLAR